MPPWAVAAAVVVALVPATWLTAQRMLDGPERATPPTQGSTDLPIPPVSPSKTPSTTPSTTPSAAPTTRPPARLPKVAPDAPRRITAGDLIDAGFDNAVSALEASSAAEVARLEDRGSPGSPGSDTVYVVGRVLADGGGAFDRLPDLERGEQVSIRTDAGTMTYTVRSTALRSVGSVPDLLSTRRPGRLVLVGNRYDASGDRLAEDLVVTAELTGARPS